MKFAPFSDRVLIRPDTVAPRKSVLSSPDAQKEKPTTGVVLAVGPDVPFPRDEPGLLVQSQLIGKRIQWQRFSGREIAVDGEALLLLRFEEIDGEFVEE